MTLKSTTTYLGALLGTNIKSSFSLRGAFLLQALFMLVNNVVMFSVWLLFFTKFDDIGGWKLADMALLYGLVECGFGIAMVFAGGVRELSRMIVEGDLDPWLTQPRHPLPRVAASRLQASGWGDILSGVALTALSGHVGLVDIPLASLAVVCVATLFTMTSILIHCVAFWAGAINSLARTFSEWLIMLAIYPQTIYSGWLKVLIFTAVPAGFLGYFPVTAVKEPGVTSIGGMVGGTLAFTLLALWAFHRGLRRYASGNRIGGST